MAKVVSSLDFEKLVKEEKTPLLIDVFGAWCQPCVQIAPSIDALSEQLAGQATVVKIDRDEARRNGDAENPLLRFMKEQGIQGIPALLLFDKGEYKDVLMGGPRTAENIREWMEETLSKKFNEAAAPAASAPAASNQNTPLCARYGIVLENLPADAEGKMKAAGGLPGAVCSALSSYVGDGEVREIGIGPITDDGSKSGVYFIVSRRAAEALANALPGENIVDAAGIAIEPATPKARKQGPKL